VEAEMRGKRVAIYTRVSTDKQTTANQLVELRDWATRCGHTVVKVFEDHGISGAKGRDTRPAFDSLLKAAVRRDFDIVATWSSDRLGRSLPHLIEVLQTIRDTNLELYIHTQSLDTTTPAGRAMFGMLGVFSEFEREMIVARVNAGIARARREGTKSGKAIGRPKISMAKEQAARALLVGGMGILKVAKTVGLGSGTVQSIRRAMA
jgi:DNA invertase Pin-like site-specific DNA recombinase